MNLRANDHINDLKISKNIEIGAAYRLEGECSKITQRGLTPIQFMASHDCIVKKIEASSITIYIPNTNVYIKFCNYTALHFKRINDEFKTK